MKQIQFGLLLLTITFLTPVTSHACRSFQNQKPLLHEHAPALSEAVNFIARVEILKENRPEKGLWPLSFEARISDIISGDYNGEKLIITPLYTSSCDSFARVGDTGIIAGNIVSRTTESIYLDPLRAPNLLERQRAQEEQNESKSESFSTHSN